jgi:hypothetical protein
VSEDTGVKFDVRSAWGRLTGKPRKTKGVTAASRDALEKPPLPASDPRRQRSTGRTAQTNIKLKPDFREELFSLAAERNIGLAELMEQIVAEWKAERGK